MNLKKKVLAAAVAMAVSGGASAAISGGDQATLGSTEGPGELFFSLWDSVAAKSYTLDLGISINEFRGVGAANPGLTSSAMSIAADTNLQKFMFDNAANSAGWQWNLAGQNSTFNQDPLLPDDHGIVVTTNNDLPAVLASNGNFPSAAAIGKSMQKAGGYLVGVNGQDPGLTNDYAANFSTIVDNAATPGAYAGGPQWGSDYGGTANGWTTSAGVDQTLDFYFIGIDDLATTGGATLVTNLTGQTGFTWKFANDGTLSYSAVPIPPALWLLGSALVGLAGVARRRAAKV